MGKDGRVEVTRSLRYGYVTGLTEVVCLDMSECWNQWRAVVIMVTNFGIYLTAEQLSASSCSLFSAPLHRTHRATHLRVLCVIESLVSGFIILRLVALCTAALAAGPPATSAIISGGGIKNPFLYYTWRCLFNERVISRATACKWGRQDGTMDRINPKYQNMCLCFGGGGWALGEGRGGSRSDSWQRLPVFVLGGG